jgi:hypothetical protein
LNRLALLLIAALAFPLAAQAPRPYHLELEANPSAPFPYLGKFGAVDLHVYAGGVYADSFWLDGISRNNAKDVIVANPLGRMYFEVPVSEIAATVRRLAGSEGSIEQQAAPTMGPAINGKVRGVDATRYRLVYGDAWIDMWTTKVIPENPQLKAIVRELLRGISPGTAKVAEKIPGTPVYVELNFRRFKKVPLLTLKKLTFAKDDEEDALTLGALYLKGSASALLGK